MGSEHGAMRDKQSAKHTQVERCRKSEAQRGPKHTLKRCRKPGHQGKLTDWRDKTSSKSAGQQPRGPNGRPAFREASTRGGRATSHATRCHLKTPVPARRAQLVQSRNLRFCGFPQRHEATTDFGPSRFESQERPRRAARTNPSLESPKRMRHRRRFCSTRATVAVIASNKSEAPIYVQSMPQTKLTGHSRIRS